MWPDPIPGQRLGIDPNTSTGYIAEPLHEPKNRVLREKIIKQGYGIAEEKETLPNAHVPTYLFWFKRLVESGAAKVVKGTLPETIDGEPQTEYWTHRRKSSNDRLAEAMDRQTEMLSKVLAALASKK